MSAAGQVLVVAGEPSGDRIAAPVVNALQRRHPQLRFFGAGGAALAAAGVTIRHHCDDLAATGISEAASCLPAAVRLLADCAVQLIRRRPLLALLVDYPGANLRIAQLARRAGVPVLQYVAPQRWAWLGWRLQTLQRCVGRLAVVLPFEEAWFRQRGVAARFVGHPLRDLFRMPPADELHLALGEGSQRAPIALLPGSRQAEIRRHLPVMLEALRLLPAELQPVIASLPGAAERCCRQMAPGLPLTSTASALSGAQIALCASGSATLEVALAGVPAVVCYRLSASSYFVARRLVRVPHIALPNLVLGQRVLPELLQEQLTPRSLAAQARQLLDPALGRSVREQLGRVAERLGPPGVAQRVAALAEELLPVGARLGPGS